MVGAERSSLLQHEASPIGERRVPPNRPRHVQVRVEGARLVDGPVGRQVEDRPLHLHAGIRHRAVVAPPVLAEAREHSRQAQRHRGSGDQQRLAGPDPQMEVAEQHAAIEHPDRLLDVDRCRAVFEGKPAAHGEAHLVRRLFRYGGLGAVQPRERRSAPFVHQLVCHQSRSARGPHGNPLTAVVDVRGCQQPVAEPVLEAAAVHDELSATPFHLEGAAQPLPRTVRIHHCLSTTSRCSARLPLRTPSAQAPISSSRAGAASIGSG